MRTILAIAFAFVALLEAEAATDRLASTMDATEIVRELPSFPTGLQGGGRLTPEEKRRESLYRRLIELGPQALPALRDGLRDESLANRRAVALAVEVVSSSWWTLNGPRLNIEPLLEDTVRGLQSEDPYMRARSAGAIYNIGPKAEAAVPELLVLLNRSEVGSRLAACFALRGIGPAAKAALPMLRRALEDPSIDVRKAARHAIEGIEQ